MIRDWFALTVAAVLASASSGISLADEVGRVLPSDSYRSRAIDVPSWNPESSQKLVRIEGRLYQEDAGRYFAVIPGRITVRLGQGLRSWDALVREATSGGAREFDALRQLSPMRLNRLGVLRLGIPAGSDPTAWCGLVERTGLARYAEVATYGMFDATVDDPLYPDQWSLKNSGQAGGAPGADVDAEAAWDLTAGDPAIIVAVLDSGTEIDHEDLAANVWHNDGEIPGNGVDDDGNGYVDDWEGWDFHNMNNDPRPIFYHGTHVTGIVNAVGNNGIGIAGLAGGLEGAGVRGMALGVGDDAENGDVIDEAVLYAADNGAHVITFALATAESQAINDALDYAYFTKDVFIDCSAGNSNAAVGYPARHPVVMAVASTDNRDEKSGFSSFGPEVEIAAPGENIRSTRMNDTYGSGSGTSFAAPHVAATAALVRGLNPNLLAADVRTLLVLSTDDVGHTGYDVESGYGRLNAFRTVSLATTSDGIVRFSADESTCNGSVDLVVVDHDLASSSTLGITVASDSEPGGEAVVLTESSPGSGLFRGSIATSYDAAVPDGTLQVADGDTLVAEYLDIDDGTGGPTTVKSDSATIDCVAPAFFDVRVEGIVGDAATVSWSSDERATSIVGYGDSVPPLEAVSSERTVVEHSLDLGGLAECTVYHYSVGGVDPAGNVGVDDNGGTFFHFETLADFGQGLQPCHQGRVAFDVETVGCSSSLPVTLGDRDLNTDPGVAESVHVTLTSTTEPLPEILVLTETAPDSSIFSGTMATGPAPATSADGVLQLAHGDLLTVTYEDGDDGSGVPATTFGSATGDCLGPVHSGVRVLALSDHDAVVEWSAAEPMTGAVEWGSTPGLGNIVSTGSGLATVQAVTIGDFPECGEVYFRLRSTDAAGNESIADAAGQPFRFDAFTLQGIVYEDDFEVDVGWLLEGEWEIGVPQGLGTSPGDPASSVDGTQVLGHDLSGQGAALGDYEVNRTRSAISPVMDLSALDAAELRFDRWLNVENTSTSAVDVRDGNGVWRNVWTTTAAADTAWSEQSFDVTAHAAGNPAFQLRFLQNSRFRTAAGWNVDGLILRDASVTTYGACVSCDGAPTFAGALAASDDDACADTTVTVAWSGAPAWGSGTGGSYAIYRHTVPGFTPDPGNLMASGVAATTWTDPAPPAGVPLYYVVRAENDELCGAGPNNGGLTDDNSIEVATVNETSQPALGDVGNSLQLAPVNGVHVRLTWTAAQEATAYNVYRSASPDAGASRIAATLGTLFEDPGALGGSGTLYYTVRAGDSCGNESAD